MTAPYWICLALCLASCGKKSKKDAPAGPAAITYLPNMSMLIFHLPTALSPQNAGFAAADPEDSYKSLLFAMRPLLGTADSLIQGAVQQIFSIIGKPQCLEGNSPDNCDGYKGLAGLPSINGAPAVYPTSEAVRSSGGPYLGRHLLNGEGAAYVATYQFYWKVGSLYRKGLQLEVSRANLTTGEGRIKIWPRNMGRGSGPEFISVLFSSSSSQQQMSVQLLNALAAAGLPQRVSYTASRLEDGSITGFGATLRGLLTTLPSSMENMPLPFSGTDPMAMIFRFSGLEKTNRAALDLALLSQDQFTNSDAFSSYSVYTAMKNHAIKQLRSGTACTTQGTVLGLAANICADQIQIGDDAVWSASNSYCAANPTAFICTDIVKPAWIWQNPLYLSASGFRGTGVYNSPADGYENLTAPLSSLPQASATALWNAVVDSDGATEQVN